MPEGVRIDVGQIVTLAEFVHPAGHAIRMDGISIVLRKYKALIPVVFTQTEPFRVLPCSVLPQELHRFRRKCDVALGGICFRSFFVNASI